jgi:hypothetical protein
MDRATVVENAETVLLHAILNCVGNEKFIVQKFFVQQCFILSFYCHIREKKLNDTF